MVTIATHNGAKAHREHNIRSEKVVSKEEHIQKDGLYEIWKDEKARHAYHTLFDASVSRYNDRQERADRKIKDYYTKIQKDAKKHPVYEMIIGIYPVQHEHLDMNTQRSIMKEFVESWEERNPNLYLCGAYFHADEEGEPHVHIDYIPVAHGYTKGMDTQTGLVKALKEQGFEKQGKATAQIQWEKRENQHLEELCKKRGLDVSHPSKDGIKHLQTDVYKAQIALEKSLDNAKGLLDAQDELNAKINELEAKRDRVEEQVERALERKVKAFKKSFKKDKDCGWAYDQGLYEEIKTLVNERSKDVEKIGHTDLDIEYQFALANNARIQSERELMIANKLKEDTANLIDKRARILAKEKFERFKANTFGNDRESRLEEYCKDILFKDGTSILDRFNQMEEELRRSMESEWESEWER